MTKTIDFKLQRSFIKFLMIRSKLDFKEKVTDDNPGIGFHMKNDSIEGQLPQNDLHQQKTYFRCVENYHKLTHPVINCNYSLNKLNYHGVTSSTKNYVLLFQSHYKSSTKLKDFFI